MATEDGRVSLPPCHSDEGTVTVLRTLGRGWRRTPSQGGSKGSGCGTGGSATCLGGRRRTGSRKRVLREAVGERRVTTDGSLRGPRVTHGIRKGRATTKSRTRAQHHLPPRVVESGVLRSLTLERPLSPERPH